MPDFSELIKSLPEETQRMLKSVWEYIPPEERKDLQSLFSLFPSEQNMMRMLVRLSLVQFKLAFGQKSKVAIVGPANVGKSTLYNQFVRAKEDQAAVSPLPGTTRISQEADAGLFALVDTPGADAVGEVGEAEKKHAMQAAQDADVLIILFDAIQGVKRTEQELFGELTGLNKPYIVALNKIDLVKRDEKGVLNKAAVDLRLKPEQVLPISAKDGKGVSQVLVSIAAAEPEIVAALGSALPAYRWQLAWRAIVSGASVSAVIALAPLPVIDFAPLIVTQSAMVLAIARIYNYKITLQRARELVATFGLGLLGRTIFQQLSLLGGPPGWLLASAVAASTTVVMGYAAAIWFERGERLSNEALKRLTQAVTQELLESIRSLGKKKPSRENLQRSIAAALEKSPIALSHPRPDGDKANPESEISDQNVPGK
jgi:small GTP-binding protein